MIDSLPEAHLEGVVIEFASELIVMFGNSLTCCSSAFAEHRWQVISLCVNKLFASRLSFVAFKSMWVNDGFNIFSVSVNHVIGGSEVALLKSVLRRTMACKQMVGESALQITHLPLFIFVLFLSLSKINDKVRTISLSHDHQSDSFYKLSSTYNNHLTILGDILVDCS